ncbi:MAG: 1-(5-phosphoribosyl)-5-[(5-phosphoribosylamino)methylideneamino]imidazole-4-carboxamide isomerase [Candidatus Desulfofervidaceae bacterium]|nr:1-(5-phosphoribosyl)-5-[(5-phosphoribosylamino)methylideneamino]imidazole-4-carboxamide isomerase [Candidatus Desulfofervidaceae bacterium]
MVIIPAIDLKEGRCVRLIQGKEGTETVFHEDPIAVARFWEEQGAKRLHIIDLDGAFLKRPYHVDIVTKIAQAVTIPVQVGGGIRTVEDIEAYLNAGVRWVILGTLALENEKGFAQICKRFPDQIILAIDAKNGKVAIEGWKKVTGEDAFVFARRAEKLGVAGINYTDISRDGMETGPNIESLRQLLEKISLPVYVAGGIASLEDIEKLLPLKAEGLAGAIIGRALYTGKIDLKKAIELAGRA